jgi:hypothetical protein
MKSQKRLNALLIVGLAAVPAVLLLANARTPEPPIRNRVPIALVPGSQGGFE